MPAGCRALQISSFCRQDAGATNFFKLVDKVAICLPNRCMTIFDSVKEGAAAWIDRRAKLFEAGDYPDRALMIAAADLARLEANFKGPVPVLIEHASSPLELGYLTQVEACGDELFGTVSLSSEANALIERSGAKSLSLGLASDLSEIREVSLVSEPRVADAQLFGRSICFVGRLCSDAISEGPNWKREAERLLADQRARESDELVDRFVNEGKLLPSQAGFAKALLQREDRIDFGGERKSIRQLLISLIERQPRHEMFSEKAPHPAKDYSEHLLLPEEVAFYERNFPGVKLEEIAKRKR